MTEGGGGDFLIFTFFGRRIVQGRVELALFRVESRCLLHPVEGACFRSFCRYWNGRGCYAVLEGSFCSWRFFELTIFTDLRKEKKEDEMSFSTRAFSGFDNSLSRYCSTRRKRHLRTRETCKTPLRYGPTRYETGVSNICETMLMFP